MTEDTIKTIATDAITRSFQSGYDGALSVVGVAAQSHRILAMPTAEALAEVLRAMQECHPNHDKRPR